jgi:ubiquinone/menaquinone biosynthesis C-methylase UbiE
MAAFARRYGSTTFERRRLFLTCYMPSLMNDEVVPVVAERQRLKSEYDRRAIETEPEIYAPWQPAEIFARHERKRVAARMLQQAGNFPAAGHQCLEVGCGASGWLPDLLSWGVNEQDLHGVDLRGERIRRSRDLLPAADLRIGDAVEMPWENETFDLVIASTVFTSVLSARVRELLAREIVRVLRRRGACLWYDFAFNNPYNPHVQGIKRNEIKSLFPQLRAHIRSVTLAPPIARFIAPRSSAIASLLEAVPFLRTHLLAVLIKS